MAELSGAQAPNVEQSDIVEALVREYLVRVKATSTLEAFNREKPKHGGSITKREVLRKNLGLDRATLLWKRQNPEAESVPSTLEVWVNYQMQKTGASADATGMAKPPGQASRPTERAGAGTGLAPPPGAAAGARPPPPRQGFTAAAPAGSSPASGTTGVAAATNRMAGLSVNGASTPDAAFQRTSAPGMPPPRGVSPAGAVPASSRTSAAGLASSSPQPPSTTSPAAPRSTSHSGSPAPNRAAFSPAIGQRPGVTSPTPAAPAPAAVGAPRPASRQSPQPRAQAPPRAHHNELVMEDVDDLDDLDHDVGVPTGFAAARPGGAGPSIRKQGTPVAPDVMRAVKQLLWGAQGQPPPSWKQGFYFNTHAGLQFGLVQKQGGPCGVLAAVQAHILGALHSSGGSFNLTPRQPEQHSALTTAIAECLWQARMGPTAQLVLPEGEAGAAAGRLGYDQMARTVAQHSAASKEALTDLVRGALPALMAADGWGVVLFVLSLVLSRGVANVQGDMDEPNNSLMGMHGYCTQELVHLILLGTAVSNVFDGHRDLDGTTTLKGIGRRCRLGMLTLFEWYKYVEVGPSLKNPSLPVWVICSESHFTVLFSQDSRCLRDQLPFDLYYYDELANQEHIIKLSVSKDPAGGWTAKTGTTIGDRGKCEDKNIPPLECVIETRWPGVKVNWNGTEPIL